MNRLMILGIVAFFGLVSVAMMNVDQTAVAGHGCKGCAGSDCGGSSDCGGRKRLFQRKGDCGGRKARRNKCCGEPACEPTCCEPAPCSSCAPAPCSDCAAPAPCSNCASNVVTAAPVAVESAPPAPAPAPAAAPAADAAK